MLLVKTYVDKSKIKGLGLFAAELIPKGKKSWIFHEGYDAAYTEEELGPLPKIAQDRIMHYCYIDRETRKIVLCCDDARFMNHSDDPNTIPADDGPMSPSLASRDIHQGEEITYDYYAEDGDALRKLGR